MGEAGRRPKADHALVQIIDTALAKNAAKCGTWLECRPGCSQCCIGVFEISQLDAARLREGLAELGASDPKRAEAVRRRAERSRKKLARGFPGDVQTGVLHAGDERFEEFGNEEPCPALDPKTGMCDLYEHRPITCRVFGPPVRTEDGYGVCELCFRGATEEEVAACELEFLHASLEERVMTEYEKRSGQSGKTIVAWALK